MYREGGGECGSAPGIPRTSASEHEIRIRPPAGAKSRESVINIRLPSRPQASSLVILFSLSVFHCPLLPVGMPVFLLGACLCVFLVCLL